MIQRMNNIHHIDQLPYYEAIRFAVNNEDNSCYHETEKIDGCNISLCLIDDKMYIKTKKAAPTRDPEVFKQLADKFESPLMLEFSRFLNNVLDNEQKLVQCFKKYKLEQLFGELVPICKPNIIQYSAADVRGGVFYIFDDINHSLHETLISIFQNKWRILSAIDLKLGRARQFAEHLRDYMYRYGGDLRSLKRDDVSLERKRIAKERYQHILLHWKKELLKELPNIKSQLGATLIEGIILENRAENIRIKVVDLDGFGKERADEWSGSDQLKKNRKQLFKNLIVHAFGNPDILTIKEKQDQKLIEVLEEQNKKGTIWIYSTLLQDALNEADRDSKDVVDRAIKIFEAYLQDIIKIKAVGQSAKVVIAEVKDICKILEDLTLTTNKKNTKSKDIRLLEYVLGYKRCNELIKRYS